VDLGTFDGVHDLVVEGRRVMFEVDTARVDAVVGALHAAGIRSLTATPPTLEELFLRHYGDDLAAVERQDALERA
jgi:ABC-2 type transport system ATP-binding protein